MYGKAAGIENYVKLITAISLPPMSMIPVPPLPAGELNV
jgi:hypothetical protein